MTPRRYQTSSVAGVWGAWCSGSRRVLLTLPTGTGKTEVAASIVADYGGPVLWVAHRRELVDQAIKRLVAAGVPRSEIGEVLAGRPPDASRRVQVGSVETLRRRDMPPADLVVVDEAHHAAAKTWAALLDLYPTARILGLSATPWRSGRKQLAEHFDALVCGAKPSELIRDGWMAEPRVFAPEDALTPDLSEVRTSGDDYNLADLAKATNRSEIVGDIVAHRQAHAVGLAAVAYAVNVEHAESIAEAFVEAGERWAVLTGKTPLDERAAMLAALEAGTLDGIANCMVLTEGWDCPAAKCIIVARPTKSEGLYLQMVGRGLRPWHAVTPIILDHAGNARWFDLPQTDREMTLKRTPMRRGKGHGGVLARSPSGELVRREGELVEVTGPREPDRCDECGNALGMSRTSQRRRRRKSRPWDCVPCRNRKLGRALTPEQRSKAGRTRGAAQSMEHRRKALRKGHDPEHQRASMALRIAALTTEQRNERIRKLLDGQSQEQRRENARKASAASAARTPEQRSEAANRAWVTKRAKSAQVDP